MSIILVEQKKATVAKIQVRLEKAQGARGEQSYDDQDYDSRATLRVKRLSRVLGAWLATPSSGLHASLAVWVLSKRYRFHG